MAGKRVEVAGWVHHLRKLGGITFLILRDRSGLLQMVARSGIPQGELPPPESVVRAVGRCLEEARAPGGVELHIDRLEILAHAGQPLPIHVGQPRTEALNLETVLDHRSISLRAPKRLAIFRLQSAILESFSAALRKMEFTEIKSSKLVSSGTEGGSNLFYLDYFGKAAFLAQSPQFYKQILVGTGLERVFEIGPVFRAEPHNTSRHLNEYTSLDFEMGFIDDENDVMDTEAEVIGQIIEHLANHCRYIFDLYGQQIPQAAEIPRLPLQDAGRILTEQFSVQERIFHDLSPAEEKQLWQWAREEHGSDFLFITRYPAKKRPVYTMPCPENPTLTRSFDLLFRGLEITTGGQRIHDYRQLEDNMRKFGLDPADFKDYLECFRYGMPPHGGLAIGLERLTMQLLGLDNVREASLFPRDKERLRP